MSNVETNQAHRDFAKIVRSSCGRQVLFFVEPEDGDYKFHQVVNFDGAQADLAVGFSSDNEDANESAAFRLLERVGAEHADLLISEIARMTGMEAA